MEATGSRLACGWGEGELREKDHREGPERHFRLEKNNCPTTELGEKDYRSTAKAFQFNYFL
jgi:hypothetical protein